jgi:hypothetical protein
VILEANFLKKLGLAWCDFTNFKLVTKGACKSSSLSLKTVDIDHLDLGSHTHCLGLKKVEVKEPCSYVWTVVDSILSKPSLKLRELQLKGIPLGTNYPIPLGAHHPMNLNLETIACLFPHLNDLGLSYTLVENNLPTGVESQLLQGSTVLERVQFLELGCPELGRPSSSSDEWGPKKKP